jgi:hypothetical protein
MLYEIFPHAPWSNHDPIQKPKPHANGIIGSTNVKNIDLVMNRLKDLSLSQPIVGQDSTSSSTTTQSTYVHYVQSSPNLNGNQQPRGTKKKGRGNNCKGGKNNNKVKDENNNDKSNNNDGWGKKEKRKLKFPYKLCKYYHLTHLFPKIKEALRLLSQPSAVLTNPFPHNQLMVSETSNTGNVLSGSQNPSEHEGGHLWINMVKSQIDVATRSCDYGSS